jgi:D-alanyl-lipoteichoic acid acyltransferase DltB (MBOAT superfamily)
MLFNSYTFLFVFLPVVLAGAFLLVRYRTSLAVAWLVFASFFFYGWWSPRHVLLLAASIAFNYVAGEAIARRGGKQGENAFGILCAAVAANLALLGYFKYASFFVANADALFGTGMRVEAIVLPLSLLFLYFGFGAYRASVQRAEEAFH